jgi:hypothetical protein
MGDIATDVLEIAGRNWMAAGRKFPARRDGSHIRFWLIIPKNVADAIGSSTMRNCPFLFRDGSPWRVESLIRWRAFLIPPLRSCFHPRQLKQGCQRFTIAQALNGIRFHFHDPNERNPRIEPGRNPGSECPFHERLVEILEDSSYRLTSRASMVVERTVNRNRNRNLHPNCIARRLLIRRGRDSPVESP